MKVLARLCPDASHQHLCKNLFHPFIDGISTDASDIATERVWAKRSFHHTILGQSVR